MEEPIRKIYYYQNYYLDFLKTLPPAVQKKFQRTLMLVRSVLRIPKQHFKHITGSEGLYEIRVEVGTNIYRVFCFFDVGKLIVLVNGFHKKTQKTSRAQIELAEKLRYQYFKEMGNEK